MPDDLAALGAKFDQVGKLLTGGHLRQITTRVASRAKPVAAAAIEPKTLSHWGRGGRNGGYKVGARYEVKSDSEAVLQPTVAPLAALLEKGSGTTWKAPRRRGSGRRKRGTVRTYTRARVPAREAWTKGAVAAGVKIPGFVDDEVQRVLREVF